MAKHYFSITIFFCLASLAIPLLLSDASSVNVETMKTYIVYLGSLPENSSYSPTSHHLRMLQQVTQETDDAATSSLLVHSYKRSFNGFAAKLTEEQRDKIAQMEEVVSIFPSTTLRVKTTRSWDFMGFIQSSKRNVSGESDVIIGFLDGGIWLESESFSDKGFSPPPKKWKGTCAGGKNFTCNNKVIGARFYGDEDTARDFGGHGSHTASTAAGNNVNGASFYGIAEGTARGGAPTARIAVYKVCDDQGYCDSAGIMAAFDDAIADGVDILSVSLGRQSAPEHLYDDDEITIGSFHAMAKGVLTVQAAGNEGPEPGSVTSVAPWILSVAANTIDREIVDKLVLGNGTTLVGDAVNAFDPKGKKYPIAKCEHRSYAEVCECLKIEVRGKIVLCGDQKDLNAHDSGAAGLIMTKSDPRDGPTGVTSFPYLTLSPEDYNVVESYSNKSANPEAEIMKSESVVDKTAPRVAIFSSRGPSITVPGILKPDVTAPGVYILAAYSSLASPSDNGDIDPRRVKYNILSGTSMSCPHASGIAAYVKSFHLDWSPAAIKSAIMTTAKPLSTIASNDNGDHVNEFAYGSGHVNPVQAIDPGLVYDLSKQDYLELLCNLGYSTSNIKRISGDRHVSCPKSHAQSLIKNANFPSILAEVQPMKPFSVEINRTVTNVGSATSEYKVTVQSAPGVNITVKPEVLSFKSLNEKQSFVVRIVGGKLQSEKVLSSSLVWSDGTHHVRSPIIVNELK